MTTGIEAWSWVIGERADLEMALLTEIEAAWNKTIEDRMGLFSTALQYVVYVVIPVGCSSLTLAMPIRSRIPSSIRQLIKL